MYKKHLITLCLLFIFQDIAYSFPNWGQTGHRTVGEIASEHITRKTRKKIEKLLNGQSLAFISTYADEIKSDKNFRKYSPWHYVNFPFDCEYHNSKKNPKGDIIVGINKSIKILKDKNSSKRDKIFYLKMLVHLIGDLHQPLHAGRSEDKGGNTIQVRWFDKGTNLHRVWDTDMIEQWKMTYTELTNTKEKLSKKEIENIQKGTILDWTYETQKLAKKVYASVKPGDKLKYRYSYLHFETVRTQLQKGGLRLAKVLNDIFK